MNTKDPNLPVGLACLAIGMALMIALDPWFIGIAFLLVGAQRLWVVYSSSSGQDIAAGD